MKRRAFIQKMFFNAQAMLLMGFVDPRELLAAFGEMDGQTLHYRPLNGRSLRDMALGKEHHGRDAFINPIGASRKGRFFQLLKWKLSQNSFRPFLKDQPTRPIAIDWEPVRRTEGYPSLF